MTVNEKAVSLSEAAVEAVARSIWGNIAPLTEHLSEVPWEQVVSRPRHQGLYGVLKHAARHSMETAAPFLHPDRDSVIEKRDATGRSPKDYAVEFGNYLARSAQRFMDTLNSGGVTADDWDDLRSSIYEFRKRAVKASIKSTDAPEKGK